MFSKIVAWFMQHPEVVKAIGSVVEQAVEAKLANKSGK
jgi:hypothetical protein